MFLTISLAQLQTKTDDWLFEGVRAGLRLAGCELALESNERVHLTTGTSPADTGQPTTVPGWECYSLPPLLESRVPQFLDTMQDLYDLSFPYSLSDALPAGRS